MINLMIVTILYGAQVLDRLIKTGKYNITTVHRGSKKFDSGERIDPHVNVVPCNRHKKIVCDDQEKCEFNALKYCPKLMGVLESTPKIDVVLDFSGYEVATQKVPSMKLELRII